MERLQQKRDALEASAPHDRHTMLTQLGDLVVPASVVSAATPKAASGGAGGGAGAGGGYAGAKAQPSDAQLLRAAAAKRRKELEESKVSRGGIRGEGCLVWWLANRVVWRGGGCVWLSVLYNTGDEGIEAAEATGCVQDMPCACELP